MGAFCNWVRTGKRLGVSRPYAILPDPTPEVMAKRPDLAPSVGTCFATDEHLDAQLDWLAHACPERRRRVAAGRITIG